MGFEIVFLKDLSTGHRLTGHTTALESSTPWSIGYDVTMYRSWSNTAVHASQLSAAGERS